MLKGTPAQPHSSWAWSVVRHTSLMVYTSLLLALNLFVVLSPSWMVQQIIHFYWLPTYLRCGLHLSWCKTLHFVKIFCKKRFLFLPNLSIFSINSILICVHFFSCSLVWMSDDINDRIHFALKKPLILKCVLKYLDVVNRIQFLTYLELNRNWTYKDGIITVGDN